VRSAAVRVGVREGERAAAKRLERDIVRCPAAGREVADNARVGERSSGIRRINSKGAAGGPSPLTREPLAAATLDDAGDRSAHGVVGAIGPLVGAAGADS